MNFRNFKLVTLDRLDRIGGALEIATTLAVIGSAVSLFTAAILIITVGVSHPAFLFAMRVVGAHMLLLGGFVILLLLTAQWESHLSENSQYRRP